VTRFSLASSGTAPAAVDPSDADAAFNAGLAALKAGREAEALPLLAAARAAHRRDARLWQVTGLLHRSLDDLAPAVAAFAKAAGLAPRDALIAHGHARAALEAGLPALSLFERAHCLAPSEGPVLLGLATARFAEEGPRAAIEGIDEQLRQHPGWMPGHALIARLRWMSGERAGFTASIERALATAPRDVSLWRELISTLMHAELYDDALAAIARGRAAAGPHLAFDANEAVCVAEKGEFEAADRLFAALAALDDVTVTVRRIRHLLRSGRPGEAAAMAEAVAATAGADFVWPYLSVAWRLLGDPRRQWLEGDERLVGVYDLADKLPSLEALAERLRRLHIATDQPLEQSVRGGTQTDGPLFSRIEPEIRALRKVIVEAVERHVAQLPPHDGKHPLLRHRRGARIRFTGSWSVRLAAQGHHANHIHPAGWFSSAFYVALPGEAERGAAPAGWLSLGQPQAQLGVDLPPTRLIEPKPGRLVLFPSTMWHGTMPFAAGERLTVAFDVAPPR
jgi:putative 2-oxoglutarate-Fe(II)-dependent oxygenase superfamily protein